MKGDYNQAGLKAIRSSYLGGQIYWVFIEECESEILIKKGSTSPSTLAWVSTVHKVQGLTLEQGVDFDLRKQNLFGA